MGLSFQDKIMPVGTTGNNSNLSFSSKIVPASTVTTPTATDEPFKFSLPETPETPDQKMARIKASDAEIQAQANQDRFDTGVSPLKGLINFTRNFGESLVGNVASSEVGLGNTIAGAGAVNRYADTYSHAIDQTTNSQALILRLIGERKARGIDTTNLERSYNSGVDVLKELTQGQQDLIAPTQKSNLAVAGEIGGTALDLLSAGTYGEVAKGMTTAELAAKKAPSVVGAITDLAKKPAGLFTKEGIAKVAEGTGIGYGFDVTQGLQGNRGQDRMGVNALIPGAGTLVGGGLPVLTEGAKSLSSLNATGLEQRYKNQVVEDWNRIGSDYVKSNKILVKGETLGKDAPTFLAEQGINPQSLVEGGKFRTNAVADRLVTQDVKPFEAVLDQTLKTAEQGQPPLQISELQKESLRKAGDAPNLTLGQKADIKAGINREYGLLHDQYGDTITLTQLNQEKRTYWSNTKFDSMKPLQGDVHYIIGSTAKTAIENNVSDVNVKELNNYLGDFYNSAKFLRSMDGRVPKATLLTKVGREATKFAAATLGDLVGGVPGGIAGYGAGRTVARALESFSNPVKAYFLNNLEKTNPQVYEDAIKYITEQEAERLKRPLLSAPAPLGSDKNPIIPPAPTTYEAQAEKPITTRTNKTGDVYQRNLKTGETKIIPNKNSSGKATVEALGSGAVLTGAASIASIPSVSEYVKKDANTVEASKLDVNGIKDALAYNETRGQKDPYSFVRSSGVKGLGDALGKYQITEGELKSYSDKFLGKKVSRDAFLSSPGLQDAYVEAKIKYLDSKGYTPEEIFAAHRGGFSDLSKKREKVKQYKAYTASAMDALNGK